MDPTIRVVTHITVRTGNEENAKTLLKELVAATRAETGCIRYELLQNSFVSNEFALIEEWDSEEAFNTHLNSPSVEEALLESRDILASPPDIRRYEWVM